MSLPADGVEHDATQVDRRLDSTTIHEEPRGSPARCTASANSSPDRPPGARSSRSILILPTLNERAGLAGVLAELRTVEGFPTGGRPEILVVDGRSQDGTRELALAEVPHVITQSGRGKGQAVREGLEWAVAHGYETVGVIDADLTYPCDRLPTLFGLLDGGVDLVVGIRRPVDDSAPDLRDMVHRLGNGMLNATAIRFSRGPILDVCSGFWGLRASRIRELRLESAGFEIESELFVKSFRRGLRIAQIPIEYRHRVGEPKLNTARDGAKILLSILRHSLRPSEAVGSGNRAKGWFREVRRTSATTSEGTPLAVLPALMAGMAASEVILCAPPSRQREARAIARTLERHGADASTRNYDYPSPEITGSGVGRPGTPESPIPPGGRTVVVRLPVLPWGPEGPPSVLVEGGEPLQTFYVARNDEKPGRPERRRQYRRIGGRKPRAIALMAAALDRSGRRGAMLLAAANAAPAALVPSDEAPESRDNGAPVPSRWGAILPWRAGPPGWYR